jgi:peptidoglycan/LPS O-acetylase OafA/YrhL
MRVETTSGIRAQRNAGIDWVRTAMTALVIFHHTAIVYGGSGGWFWREQLNASNSLLVMFNAINQSYFMGIFFLLAGYYTPPALDRKGTRRFLADRLVRLGIPLAVFFFILHPMTVAIARTSEGEPFWAGWWWSTLERDFAPGPLWFAQALLIFTGAYLLLRRIAHRSSASPAPPARFPAASALAAAALVLGLISFLVRLVYPVGRELFWLQLGYFPSYTALFAAGCAAASSRLLEHISWSQAAPWMLASLAGCLLLPVVLVLRMDAGPFEGGWNLNALFYALWDPFVGCGMILGLLWAAQRWWSRETRLGAWLAASAFGAYIVHPPFLVALSVAAVPWGAPLLVKFALVGAAACGASFIASGLLRLVPGVGKII